MKKYHLADVLTCCEVVFTLILLGMTAFKINVDYAIWIFIIGELCDAFDGPCARRWPYPDDGKKRWWRTYAAEIDKATDVFLAIVCGLYMLFCIDTVAVRILVGLVSTICIIIQVALSLRPKMSHRTQVVLFRRYIYVIGIACTIIIMILSSHWAEWAKLLALCLGVAAGIALVIMKRNRLTQDKTPLKKSR